MGHRKGGNKIMATYEIAAPDGKVYRIDGPAGATQEQVKAEVIRQNPQLAAPTRAVARVPETVVTADRETTLGEDISQGALNVLGGAVRGAGSIGATLIRPFESSEANRVRREQMTEALQQFGVQPESTLFGAGKFGTEVAGTLPVGGLIGRGLMAAAPSAAPLATAISTSGFGGGGMLTRATGGAISGAASAAVVNPEDTQTGATVGAAIGAAAPPALKAFAGGGGWLYDAVTQRLGSVKAARIARDVAGGDLSAIKIAMTAAKQGDTAGQAAAGIPNATWQAMDKLMQGQNTGSWWTKRSAAIEAETNDALDRLAGGATATESRAVQDQTKKALDTITTPMRETSLERAGIAGAVQPGLEQTVAAAEKGAATKVEDVRRFTAAQDRWDEWAKTWMPSSFRLLPDATKARLPIEQTFPGQLSRKAEEVATGAAEESLRLGALARDAQASIDFLKAQGLQPLKPDSIVASLKARLADPDIKVNKPAAAALTQIIDMFADLTNKFGVVTPQAAYAVRKNGINSVISEFSGSEDARKKLAQTVLLEVRPLIDDAIEQAGGTGWRNYLKTFEQGMHGIEQKRMADYARELYQKGDKQGFVDLVKGNDPKAVENIFGFGRYDFTREMGGQRPKSAALEFMRLADVAQRDLRTSDLANQGKKELYSILGKYTTPLNIPSFLNAKLTIATKGLKEFEGRISKKAMATLEKSMQDGATMAQLLETLPTSERNLILKTMMDSSNWNPIIQRGAAQAATQMAVGQQ
jgi:hypothetical protein